MGNSEYGYVREGMFLAVPVIILLLMARIGVVLTEFEKIGIAMFSVPLLIQGVLMLEAMLFRFLWMTIPAWMFWRLAKCDQSKTTGQQQFAAV